MFIFACSSFSFAFRDYAKGGNAATPRATWIRLVKDASGVSDLKAALLTLEENLRGLQEGEDKIEGGRMGESAAHGFLLRSMHRTRGKHPVLRWFSHGPPTLTFWGMKLLRHLPVFFVRLCLICVATLKQWCNRVYDRSFVGCCGTHSRL